MEKIVANGDRDCTIVLDGTECSVKFDRCFRAYSVQNDSASDAFISIHQGANAGEDGVVRIKAGCSVVFAPMRLDVDTVYLNGTGEIQVHGQNDTNNSFRNAPVSGGGGNSYTKSESDAKYAQKADIPSSLPANGGNADYAINAGNADKLDGKHASDFADNIYKGYPERGNCNNATTQGVYSVSNSSQNAPDANYYLLTVDVAGDGTWIVQTAIPVNFESKIYRRMYINGVWGAWYNVTPTKSTIISGATDANSNILVFPVSSNKIPFTAFYYNCLCVPVALPDGSLCIHITAVDGTNMANTAIPSMEVFYVER